MKELIELILKHITLHPEEIEITETKEDDVDVYTINVNPEDMGRVIGKSGKVIRAIRSLVHVAAIRSNVKARVKLEETNEINQSTEEDNYSADNYSDNTDEIRISDDELPA